MTVTEYFNHWLEWKKPDLQRSTYEAWMIYFQRHIIPWFSKNANDFQQLHAADIKAYIQFIKTGDRHDGKTGGLSLPSVRKHLSLIRQSLDEAVIDGEIPNNPASSVRVSRKKQGYSDRMVMLDYADVMNLLKGFEGHRLHDMVAITLFYGLRRSEVIGLQWSSVNFDRNELRIEHTIVKNLTIEEKDTTKTAGSRAVYPMLPQVRTILLRLFAERPANARYVFCWNDGKPFRPDYVTKAFHNHLVRCNLPLMRFHDLRHSTASILFEYGMDLEEVKQWMRHSDIETTSNIYLHFGRCRKKIVSEKITNIFSQIPTE